jgi:hypothetical protein
VRPAHKLYQETGRGNQVYYFAVYYYGYEKGEDGRVHKKVKKCYLGPSVYVDVSKTHNNLGLALKGLIEEGRERDYMESLVRSVRDRDQGRQADGRGGQGARRRALPLQ